MNLDSLQRLRILAGLISLGLASAILISWSLWTGNREFPLFPLGGVIPPFPDFLGTAVAVLLLATIVWNGIHPSRLATRAILASLFFLALQDQMRWQPWVYQYGLMLVPLAFVSIRSSPETRQSILGIHQLVLVAVYFWGGVHKCHAGFISVYENSLVAPIVDQLDSEFAVNLLTAFGYAIPPIEILIGVGLLFKRTRRAALLGAIATHVVILFLLGPAKGHVSNIVVWPWNLAMSGMAIILFHKADSTAPLAFLKSRRLKRVGYGLCILLFLCPPLFYANLWDRYLSFNLYSGRQKQMLVKVPADSLERVPKSWRPFLLDPNAPDGHRILSPSNWTLEEMNVPLISEWRILRGFARRVHGTFPETDDLLFYVDYRHLPDKPKRFYTPEQIDEMRW